MSEILDKLAACEQINEWVDRHDERIAIATGEPAPSDGGSVREKWQVDASEEVDLASQVRRLIVGQEPLTGTVETSTDRTMGSVVLHFAEAEDWSRCFPVSERTEFTTLQGQLAWAALALCDHVGLAVFAQPTEDQGVEARVQVVPDEVFRRIQEV